MIAKASRHRIYMMKELSFFTALNDSQHRIDIFADS
jgi:hypothetical protein